MPVSPASATVRVPNMPAVDVEQILNGVALTIMEAIQRKSWPPCAFVKNR